MTELRRPDGRNVQSCSRAFFWPAGPDSTQYGSMTINSNLAAKSLQPITQKCSQVACPRIVRHNHPP